jgi:hypothetical protein
MKILEILDVGSKYVHSWPEGDEQYGRWVEYRGLAEDGEHRVRIAFGNRKVYGRIRPRVLLLIDGYPHAEFFGADDFEYSGEVLSEIKVRGEVGEPICRYPEEAIPDRYVMFNTTGLPTRVDAKGVHGAWAVVANVSDHESMIAFVALKRSERER